jgi:predicted nucleotide-binding protein
MNRISIALAKLSGVRVAVMATLKEEASPGRPRTAFSPDYVGHYFTQVGSQLAVLKQEFPELYGDFEPINSVPGTVMSERPQFTRSQLSRLIRDIDHMFELRANSELSIAKPSVPAPKRVFITHGRSADWREVQAFIEKDIGLPTLELAQEANRGMTVIEKLEAAAARCDSAVIVMTGDDIDENGQARARENVMHEIGYFQASFGRSGVALLHEDGVNIPTNLSGVVYIAYPKGMVSAGFHVLSRELRTIYHL